MSFFTPRGFIKRIEAEPDEFENEHIFTVQKHYLDIDNNSVSEGLEKKLTEFTFKAYDEVTGFFKNHISEIVLKLHPKLSHDQMLSYLMLSESACYLIWKDIKWMKYNGEKVKMREWIYIGILNKNWMAYLLSPWLIFLMLGSFLIPYSLKIKSSGVSFDNYYFKRWKIEIERGRKNSGCLLWWLRIKTLEKRGFNKFYKVFKYVAERLCNKRFGSCKGMFEEFYYSRIQPQHPLLQYGGYKW